jgi:signal transduction histidine kinase
MNITGNILIIDDTPANLDVLTSVLTERGHKVRPAINGEIGLRAAAKAKPDLILLDIRMAEINGFEVCERLKADPVTQDIPVIFISALDATEDKVRAFESGGVDYITKPFQVTEVLARVELQLRIQWQRRRIEALSAFKDELIGIVSHDLKNPLSLVLGYTEILQSDIANGSPIDSSMLAGIERAGQSMLSLIHDLLDTARHEQRIPLHLADVHLQALVAEQLSAFPYQIRAKSITLEQAFDPDWIMVQIDSRRFAQVIANLISNAIKYSPPHTIITVSVYRDHEHAVIDVADQGYGIPTDDLPHIFEKYFRVNRQQHMAVEGTGLGLPIARMIVEQHGGTLSAVSEEGVGSVFTIRLPLLTTA